MAMIKLQTKIALTADGSKAVPFEHPDARFLLGGKGHEIPAALAKELGIVDGRIDVELPEPEVGGPPYDLRRQAPPAKALEDYSRDELMVKATAMGIKLKAKATKAQILEAIAEQEGGGDEAETSRQDDPPAEEQAEGAGGETEGEPQPRESWES